MSTALRWLAGPALAALLAAPPVVASGEAQDEAAAALAFEERFDGRCHNLSEGGKLVVMTNRDERRAVRHRLRRTFAGRPQGGRSTGVIGPGEERKLGCSLVDGRPQRWVVERAQWERPQEDTP